MFGFLHQLMTWIYTGISWILLRWHDLWDLILGNGTFLGTNWAWILSIVFLVITVRLILFPVFVKQIRSQRAMQALQPKMKELQEKYKGDKETLRQEMMKLYQTEKVNPLMGCLPMFLQIPVFLGLFHVLRRLDPVQTINTTIYGWTQGQWDSAARARLFDAPIPAHFSSNPAELLTLSADNLTVKLVAGVLVLIMMTTTFLTSRQMILKTGWSQDPQQRMIQKLMLYGIPVSLLISGWVFPIGVIIYWVTQNLFSLGQQYWVLHKYPPPVTEGNIPMKKANRRPSSAATEEPKRRNFFARLIAPQDSDRPTATKTTSSGSRFINPVQAPKTGLFRRKSKQPEQQEPAAPETRSLAPRPGAKPVREQSKPTANKADEDTPGWEPDTDTSGDSKPSANGTGQSDSGQGGPSQNGTSPNGTAAGGGAKSTPARSNAPRGAKSTTAKKSSTPRKGPANKKGGPRR
jgi:YidC/Oxa1 family membrane protein insertase